MAREFKSNQGVDAENASALSGAPRNRKNIREDDVRNSRAIRRRRDQFYVPPDAVPKGWSVEWKRKECLGQPESVTYGMEMAEMGWKFADAKQFPMLVPPDYQGKTVERGGMVLMIRPTHMTKEAKKLDYQDAVGQVQDKLKEIGMTADGELPRKVQGFNREWDRPASRIIPDDNGADPYEEHEGSDDRAGSEV